jgi:hypothetical protein
MRRRRDPKMPLTGRRPVGRTKSAYATARLYARRQAVAVTHDFPHPTSLREAAAPENARAARSAPNDRAKAKAGARDKQRPLEHRIARRPRAGGDAQQRGGVRDQEIGRG